ncbi:MAG: DUF456 domain-containing protein [Bacteroidales bacterium]|nr:DUF456 domain-containing protein [Bacteroidales bacterium]MBQ2482423.1 DUF456 domain-containing protein [Bacteroidales bacterium]MBQ2493198.1 DUF456 domain-containing protein [Bacteroidales bacterium]MBQ4197919.1 DUF456 domain-containing protein [Bacteroidales bacterium]
MLSYVIIGLAIFLGIVGIIGCVLPVIPGPPISWAGMMILYFWGKGTDSSGDTMSTRLLLIWLAVTIVVTVLDYLVPSYLTKVSGGSKYASRGALAGVLVGLFFAPWGIVLGPMLGAFICEAAFSGKKAGQSIVPALGAFAGFVCGTLLKLISCGFMMYYIVVYCF